MFTDKNKLYIRIYRYSNCWLQSSMGKIMAWIYHDWLWIPKPLLCSDISIFHQSEHLRRPRRLWLTPLRLLVTLFNWFFLAGVQKKGDQFSLSFHFLACLKHNK